MQKFGQSPYLPNPDDLREKIKARYAQPAQNSTAAPARINEQVEIKAGEPYGEADLYREWYKARASGDFETESGLADIYLRDYPQGKYRSALRRDTAKLQEVNRENPASSAGAYFPVSQIEAMRKKRIPDAKILRTINNAAAGQLGLSVLEIETLTQKRGRHPVEFIVHPETGSRLRMPVLPLITSLRKEGQTVAGRRLPSRHNSLLILSAKRVTICDLLRRRRALPVWGCITRPMLISKPTRSERPIPKGG